MLAYKKPTGRKPTDLPIDKIRKLHKGGMNLATLARRFGVAPSTIRERIKEADHENTNTSHTDP